MPLPDTPVFNIPAPCGHLHDKTHHFTRRHSCECVETLLISSSPALPLSPPSSTTSSSFRSPSAPSCQPPAPNNPRRPKDGTPSTRSLTLGNRLARENVLLLVAASFGAGVALKVLLDILLAVQRILEHVLLLTSVFLVGIVLLWATAIVRRAIAEEEDNGDRANQEAPANPPLDGERPPPVEIQEPPAEVPPLPVEVPPLPAEIHQLPAEVPLPRVEIHEFPAEVPHYVAEPPAQQAQHQVRQPRAGPIPIPPPIPDLLGDLEGDVDVPGDFMIREANDVLMWIELKREALDRLYIESPHVWAHVHEEEDGAVALLEWLGEMQYAIAVLRRNRAARRRLVPRSWGSFRRDAAEMHRQ